MKCAMCGTNPATSKLEHDGVLYELCSACAVQLDHPSYWNRPERVAHELARMSRRHAKTNRDWEKASS